MTKAKHAPGYICYKEQTAKVTVKDARTKEIVAGKQRKRAEAAAKSNKPVVPSGYRR